MPKKVTIVTGPIVGLKSTTFIDETIEFGKAVSEKIVAFNLFSEILNQNGITPRNSYEEILHIGNLLNGYEYQFKCMREKAYLSIALLTDSIHRGLLIVKRLEGQVLKNQFILKQLITKRNT